MLFAFFLEICTSEKPCHVLGVLLGSLTLEEPGTTIFILFVLAYSSRFPLEFVHWRRECKLQLAVNPITTRSIALRGRLEEKVTPISGFEKHLAGIVTP